MSQPKIKSGILDAGTGANQVVVLDAQGDLPAVPSILTKFKPADTSRSSTIVLADDPHLSGWVLAANTFYSVEGYLEFSASSVTPDVQWGFQQSQVVQDSGFTYSGTVYGLGSPSTLFSGGQFMITDTIADTLEAASTLGVHIRGFVLTHASLATTVDFQWAQYVSDAAASVAHRGSWIRFTPLG